MKAVEEWYENGVRVVVHKKINYSGHIVEYDVAPIDIFKKLCENCWDWGDPAVIFTDKLRNYNLMQYDDEYNIETTNPCGWR
jgi:ribonucleoside-diphosphate reductase alpha chain